LDQSLKRRREKAIDQNLKKVFNEQIKLELESAYIYLSMATYFHNVGLDGMAKWLRMQAKEEVEHAMKFFDHLIDRDEKVDLMRVNIEKVNWASPLEAFKDAYEHERFVTGKLIAMSKCRMQYAN